MSIAGRTITSEKTILDLGVNAYSRLDIRCSCVFQIDALLQEIMEIAVRDDNGIHHSLGTVRIGNASPIAGIREASELTVVLEDPLHDWVVFYDQDLLAVHSRRPVRCVNTTSRVPPAAV